MDKPLLYQHLGHFNGYWKNIKYIIIEVEDWLKLRENRDESKEYW